MIRFVEEIVQESRIFESIVGRPVRILIKHKREIKKEFHDQAYSDFIKDMTCLRKDIDLVPHNENLYSLIDSCDLSVAIPFTSTVNVSSHIKKPAIYFDPLQQLLPTHEASPLLKFASGRKELLQAMQQIVSDS